jgi:Dehydrogenase E1 component
MTVDAAVSTEAPAAYLERYGGDAADPPVRDRDAAPVAKREGRVAVAMFGDGATNQWYFHECLNFAKVFLLPAVFVCETTSTASSRR